jgi:hypothetical protein
MASIAGPVAVAAKDRPRPGTWRIIPWICIDNARRLYERAGFRLAEQGEHHSFGHDLVEQVWHRAL